jgi:hypothetical protein
MATTPGRKFFDEHMKYIYANDIDGMIDDQYTQDAVLISPFDAVPGKQPPHIVRGNKELKEFFHIYLDYQGAIEVESLYDFAETDNSIFFQAIFTSKTGKWVVGDAWHMTGGKIDTHYSFAHRIGEGKSS